jgi:hypothetical protein
MEYRCNDTFTISTDTTKEYVPITGFEITGAASEEPNTSEIGECFHSLQKHVRRLVGNIPELDLPEDFDCTEQTDLIVANDGSVMFGVGYHRWLVSTKMEQIILWDGGPDNGSPLYMTSYRS